MTGKSGVIHCVSYADPHAAMAFLEKAFGFERHFIHENPDGTVAHAQMTHGDGMIMLGSAKPNDWGWMLPRQAGGVTSSAYILVADVDAHHARAIASGAEVVRPIEDKPYGRDYIARDPEGHVWSFGTYDPWA